MNIAVFDDEKHFCVQINTLIEAFFINNYPNLTVNINCFTDEHELHQYINTSQTDVAFLDISIPKNENFGIDIAKQIRRNNEKTHLVFVTSCKDKIVNAMEELIRPSQFFSKPVQQEKLDVLLTGIVKYTLQSSEYIVVKFGRIDSVININEIYSIRKNDRKTQIALINRNLETRSSVAKFHEILPSYFVNIDKGVIVNVKMIKDIDYAKGFVIMKNGEKISVSRSAKKNLRDSFNMHKGGIQYAIHS